MRLDGSHGDESYVWVGEEDPRSKFVHKRRRLSLSEEGTKWRVVVQPKAKRPKADHVMLSEGDLIVHAPKARAEATVPAEDSSELRATPAPSPIAEGPSASQARSTTAR